MYVCDFKSRFGDSLAIFIVGVEFYRVGPYLSIGPSSSQVKLDDGSCNFAKSGDITKLKVVEVMIL